MAAHRGREETRRLEGNGRLRQCSPSACSSAESPHHQPITKPALVPFLMDRLLIELDETGLPFPRASYAVIYCRAPRSRSCWHWGLNTRQMVQHEHLVLAVSSSGSKMVQPAWLARPARHRQLTPHGQPPSLDTGHLLTAQFKNYLMESNTN